MRRFLLEWAVPITEPDKYSKLPLGGSPRRESGGREMPEALHACIVHKLVNGFYGTQPINNVDRGHYVE